MGKPSPKESPTSVGGYQTGRVDSAAAVSGDTGTWAGCTGNRHGPGSPENSD